ncbi:MAG: biosynthetic-type acetolactate synthase large subunit [Defluviitaleaceae bacterium]|nr:biosynthetic-type acetolactate synthase large subunit [Defluviitaleaceae bacterium]
MEKADTNATEIIQSGAKTLLDCLVEQGVDTIFGYPGGTILNVYDELVGYQDKMKHVLTAHEQGASHAADGYARSTGKTGVCFATSGPGCTNLTTGIATAYFDSSPVVFITCNVTHAQLGRDGFQEVDICGVTKPITKANYQIGYASDIPNIVREAFAVAGSGRPGPVLIDIIKDATMELAPYTPLAKEAHTTHVRYANHLKRGPRNLTTPQANPRDIRIFHEMIGKAKKPMVICGGGVVLAKAHQAFFEFATKLDAPVAITTRGAGGFPGKHELATGMIGMHGSHTSNLAIDKCDLVIAVGCRFSDRVGLDFNTFARHAQLIHIDIDKNEINKNIRSHHHILGDAKEVLQTLNQELAYEDYSEWKEEVFSIRRGVSYDAYPGTVTPKDALRSMVKVLGDDIRITTDVGQHQMWTIKHLNFKYSGQLISSLGFGAMGFGLGAAIGVKVAFPDETVVHVTGDGSFLMNANELITCAKYKIPIITIIFNNQTLGMVRQWQNLIYNKNFSESTMEVMPDFEKLAEAYHLKGRRVTSNEELVAALEEAKASIRQGIGYVIDLAIHQDEFVKPMVKSGAHITDFTLK